MLQHLDIILLTSHTSSVQFNYQFFTSRWLFSPKWQQKPSL